ncbi:MAG TPA: class II aldolase/adducin family protein [Gemmataceae bacterium]|jgi:rhamnose utilization protein RhaD (predicted bifunctional aldolase and dehydrogenase)|nr:class II aldolase/adducin family protein [Gemmataceae bacterium]
MSDAATLLRDLAQISRFAGPDVLLVQGGGGNTSVKSADLRRMWIKASGIRLADVDETSGHLAVDLPSMLAIVRDPGLSLLPRAAAHEESIRRTQAAAIDARGFRPSLETGFHALLGRVVLHTHPVYVNAFGCMEAGAESFAEVFGGFSGWVDYAAPGHELCLRVDQNIQTVRHNYHHDPVGIVLANHGLIASGNTPTDVAELTRRFTDAGEKFFGPLPSRATEQVEPSAVAATWAGRLETSLHASGWRGVARAACYAPLQSNDRLPTVGAIVPDDVVNGIADIVETTANTDPSDCVSVMPGADRRIAFVRGIGFVLAGPNEKAVAGMEENLLANVLIQELIARRGQVRVLPPVEVDYLRNMDSEKYRQAIAAGRAYKSEKN